MRTSKTIKDPTFNIYRRGGSVDKPMESKGDGAAKKELMKLAKDEADLIFDIESEITDILTEEFKKEKKPGQSFLDWLDKIIPNKRKSLNLGLASGGKVISISEYLKQKEKPRIKKLNLDALAPGKALSELTDAEREVVRNLLRMTFKND